MVTSDTIKSIMWSLERILPMFQRKVGISAKKCKGMDCNELIAAFEKQGFYVILTYKNGNLLVLEEAGAGPVEKVMIDGEDIFEENTKFPRSAIVEIYYHSSKDKHPLLHVIQGGGLLN